MNRFLSFFILINVICFNQANAQLTVDNNTPNDNPVLLIDDILLGGGVIASNHSYMGDSIQIGYFDGSNSNLGLSSGIVLSTGDISILDPDFVDFGEFVNVVPEVTDPDLLNVANSVPALIGQNFVVNSINDVAVLEFDFIPSSEDLSFKYVFASQEYFAFENSAFNDVFGFFLSGPGIVGPYSSPAGFPNGSINIAVIPGSNPELPITISSVNATVNPDFFVNNQTLETVDDADGFTTVMTAEATVQCGELYHIRLAIADGTDGGLSSYVFLEENSFTSPELNIINDVGQDSSYIEVGCGTEVTLTAEPSDPGNYTYSWNNGANTQSITVGTGDYIVEVTSDANCALLSDTFHVEVINTVSLDLGNDLSVCLGDEVSLNIASIGGDAPFTYAWSTGETSETISVPAGTYTLDVTDANSCTAQDQITVFGVDRPTAILSGGGTICAGSSVGVPLDFVFTGTPPFNFIYENENQQFSQVSQYFNMVDVSSVEGSYSMIEISDVNCTGTVSGQAIIDTNSLPSSIISGGDILCLGDSSFIEIEINANKPYSLALNNGSYNVVYDELESNLFSMYTSDAALYKVQYIEDVNGCRSESNLGEALVAFKPYKNPQILTYIDTIVCPIHPSFQIESLYEGGIWFGNGLDNTGMFNPISAGVGKHWLTYSYPNNCNEIDSLLLEVGCDLQIFVPNSFSPNNDEENELFVIQGNNILDFEISLYNRWGKQMFYSNDITNSWDGSFNGSIVPVGTYSYVLKAFGRDGQSVRKSGNVIIIK
jgi:gliding motility-associated-like protein